MFEETQVFGKSKDNCALRQRLRNKDGNADKVRSRMSLREVTPAAIFLIA